VSAIDDPNPGIAGLGHALLRSAGVAVSVGLLRRDAARDHRGHFTRVTRGGPAITLKLARTADGFAARIGGPRLMITGAEMQARVHLMRAHADAILIGVGTVLADDPMLDVGCRGSNTGRRSASSSTAGCGRRQDRASRPRPATARPGSSPDRRARSRPNAP
jgi:diaminohydroxyphosphoribosylaminopyrimidine deaminase/5-amino-6-(5-phosphoribosylamino)uracil reductase